jgi:hypothetical protein
MSVNRFWSRLIVELGSKGGSPADWHFKVRPSTLMDCGGDLDESLKHSKQQHCPLTCQNFLGYTHSKRRRRGLNSLNMEVWMS